MNHFFASLSRKQEKQKQIFCIITKFSRRIVYLTILSNLHAVKPA